MEDIHHLALHAEPGQADWMTGLGSRWRGMLSNESQSNFEHSYNINVYCKNTI